MTTATVLGGQIKGATAAQPRQIRTAAVGGQADHSEEAAEAKAEEAAKEAAKAASAG